MRLAEYPKGFYKRFHISATRRASGGHHDWSAGGGEPAAFVGALRLKATPKVMRQRIGINYRLLFRLWPERLEVIDLINRKDLDRRIKTLV